MSKTTGEELLDIEAIKKARFIYRALNHDHRRKILLLLHRNEEMKVTDIYKKLKAEQSATSMHLGILRRAGIVRARKDNKLVFYSINYKKLREVEAKACQLNTLNNSL